MATTPTLANYNINPAPTSGTGTYGMVRGDNSACRRQPIHKSAVCCPVSRLPADDRSRRRAGQAQQDDAAFRMPLLPLGSEPECPEADCKPTWVPGPLVWMHCNCNKWGYKNFGGLPFGHRQHPVKPESDFGHCYAKRMSQPRRLREPLPAN